MAAFRSSHKTDKNDHDVSIMVTVTKALYEGWWQATAEAHHQKELLYRISPSV